MRKLYSANKNCSSNCKYCFAKWNDIYSKQPLFSTEFVDNKEAIIYPCCDGEFFMQENSIDKLNEITQNMDKTYVSISTKNEMTSDMIEAINTLNSFLKVNKKGFVKFSVSFSTATKIDEIEPHTLSYHERLNLLERLSQTDIPLSITIKPVLPFIPVEEYFKIIDDCSKYVKCILIGGLYVNNNTSFYKEYIEDKFEMVSRNVAWLKNSSKWEYIYQDEKMRQIIEYACAKDLHVFESDIDVVKSFLHLDGSERDE